MNNKAFTVSIALALFAVFMVYSFISSKEEEYKTKYGSETAVVVAKRDIKEMDEIHDNMIDIVSKPKMFVEPGKTTSKEEVTGFIATVPIRKGEQITLNKIASPGLRTGLARQVTPGKRAVSIPVDDNSAVNRLIKPGDRIDLVTVIDPPGSSKGSQVAKVFAQDVLVLAVGEWAATTAPRKVEKDDATGKDVVLNLNITRNYSTISVEVDPMIAQQIALLRGVGFPFTMLLRNNDDSERIMVGGTNLLDVLGADAGKVVRTPANQR